jgi:hypothetical protein
LIERCTAVLWHGPGHQSNTCCNQIGPHEVHECVYGADQYASWRSGDYIDQLKARGIEVPSYVDEGTMMTGFFDQPPETDW